MTPEQIHELISALQEDGLIKIVVRGEDDEIRELVVVARGKTALEFLPRVENFEALLMEDDSYATSKGKFTVTERDETVSYVEGDGSAN